MKQLRQVSLPRKMQSGQKYIRMPSYTGVPRADRDFLVQEMNSVIQSAHKQTGYSVDFFSTKERTVLLLRAVFNMDEQVSMFIGWVLYTALGTFHQAFVECSSGTFG